MLPFQLERDDRLRHKSHGSIQSSEYPLLPALIASSIVTPSFDWTSVDFLTKRNSLSKLHRCFGAGRKKFRIDIHLAGEKTIILERWEPDYFTPDRGFGRNFEDATTTSSIDYKDSLVHNRVVSFVSSFILLNIRRVQIIIEIIAIM